MSTLEEGLAEYLASATSTFTSQSQSYGNIEDILVLEESNLFNLPGEDYAQAGHFVSFLIEAHGFDAMRELCRLVPINATMADWDAATQSALDMPLADVLADYDGYPVCSAHGYRARLRDCDGEPDVIVSPTEPTEFSLRIACDEPDVIGAYEGKLMVVKRIYADTPKWYNVRLEDGDSSLDVELILEQCAPCSEEPYVAKIEPTLPDLDNDPDTACVWIESPRECGDTELSGMHAFIFFLPADLQREVTVRLTPTDTPLD